MPELPEVETVRRGLESLVIGATISGSTLGSFPGIIGEMDNATFNSLITGSRIARISRRAKYLFIETDGPVILQIHLRMTGRVVVIESGAPPIRFEYLALHLTDGRDVRYGDQRKFGRVILIDADTMRQLDQRLGPEPLSRMLTGDRLHRALIRRRTGKIKSALLDQEVIAGLGNIYVDEALFRSRIHPETVPAALTLEECRSLVRSIRAVLRRGIDAKGTTFSSFVTPYGEPGTNQRLLQVYGKGNKEEPCPRCGTTLVRSVVGGRGTTYCPRCQQARRVVMMPVPAEAEIHDAD